MYDRTKEEELDQGCEVIQKNKLTEQTGFGKLQRVHITS